MKILTFTFKWLRCVKMKVLLVDDHEMMLDGVSRILGDLDDFQVIGKCTNIADTTKFLLASSPDLLITDYNLPDGDGLALVRKVKKLYPSMKIVVLSMHDEVHLVKEILKEGIDGYILKKDSQSELINALTSIKSGRTYMSQEINTMLVKALNQPNEQKLLTDREREVLKLIAKEFTNKMIAEDLFISERTVETHRKNIFRKTQTNSLVGLIKFAYANNLV